MLSDLKKKAEQYKQFNDDLEMPSQVAIKVSPDVVLKLIADNEALLTVLKSLRYGDPICFCDVTIGSPMYSGRHSDKCIVAMALIKELERGE